MIIGPWIVMSDANQSIIFPAVFFSKDFDLTDPGVFELVHDHDRTPHKIMLEKLAYYLDVIETRLLEDLAVKGEQFFSALVTLHQLHREVVDIRCIIQQARRSIYLEQQKRRLTVENVDASEHPSLLETLVVDNLYQSRLIIRRRNLSSLYDRLKLIGMVRSSVHPLTMLHSLIRSTKDYVSALNIVHSATEVIDSQLNDVIALAELKPHLIEVEQMAEHEMTEELVIMLISNYWSTNSSDSQGIEPQLNDESTMRLITIVSLLIRIGKLSHAFQKYGERLQKELGNQFFTILYVKLHDISSLFRNKPIAFDSKPSDGLEMVEPSPALEACLQDMSSTEFIKLLEHLLMVVTGMMKQIEHAHKQFISCLERDKQPTKTILDKPMMEQKLHEISQSLYEYVFSISLRIVDIRQDANSKLTWTDFAFFYRLMSDFSKNISFSTPKTQHSFNNILNSHSKSFIEAFHRRTISQVRTLLENETWTRVDVPIVIQKIVGHLAENEEEDSSSLSEIGPTYLWMKPNRRYTLVKASIFMLNLVSEYFDMFSTMTTMTYEISNRLFELLKVDTIHR